MKYCIKCGKPNEDEALFCIACGSPFPKQEQATVKGREPAPPEKKRKWPLVLSFVGIGVVGLVGLIVVGYGVVSLVFGLFTGPPSFQESEPAIPEPVTVELVDDIWSLEANSYKYQGWELPANATIEGDIFVQVGEDISLWIVGENNLRKLLNNEGEVRGYKAFRVKSHHINYTTPKDATYYLVLYNEGLLSSKIVRVELTASYVP